MRGLMQDYPLTIDSMFRHVEQHYGDGTIVTNNPGGVTRTTYAEWAERTRRLGGVLDTLDISADGRVGTFAWNSARHLELYFGAPSTGRVLHTLNVRLFPEQLTYIANHAEDEVIFVDRTVLPLLWPLIDTMKTVRHVVVMDDGGGNEIPDDPRILDYETLLADAEPVDFGVTDEYSAAYMCYTSGTTGNPKGVVYSHRSTWLHTMGVIAPNAFGLGIHDVAMPVVPMFHANAWGIAQAAPAAGASLVMPGAMMQPEAIANLIVDEGVTFTAGVPTIWQGVLPHLAGKPHKLRDIGCGGSAVPKALSEAYREQVGLPILQAWGMTETHPVASSGRAAEALRGRRRRDEGGPALACRHPLPRGGGPDRRRRHPGAAAVGRHGHRRAAGPWPVVRAGLLQPGRRGGAHHRGRLDEDRRRRGDGRVRLHPDRRPHQGPHQVRR